MARRQIRLYDDDLLRKKSKQVKTIDDRIIQLLDDMKETMTAANGLGIAAPQVGVLKRIVVIELEEQLHELINPEILETAGTQTRTEACLSVPGKHGTVERPLFVKVKAMNRSGEEVVIEAQEILAVVMSHELDHLDGILYTDKASEIFDVDPEEDGEPLEMQEPLEIQP